MRFPLTPLARRIRELARRGERNELQPDAEPPRDLRRHVGRHTHRIAIRRLAGDQQEIGQVEASSETTDGGTVLGPRIEVNWIIL